MAEEKRLPNLMLPEFREVDFLENEYDMEIFVEPTIDTRRVVCPHCGSAIVSVHANDERFFRDINMYEKRVGVSVNGKRYKCSYCKKTFVLQYNSVEPDGKISNRLKEALQKKALNHTFTSVAEEYGLSEKTVERVFSDYSEILNLRPDVKAPRVLGIDECHLQKQMRPVYVDIEAATILEMGKSVKKVDVVRDLSNFIDLDKVEIVTTDMCSGYRSAIHETLPNALHIVDKFHVVQMFMNTVDDARKSICAAMNAKIENLPFLRQEEERRKLIDMGIDAYMFRMNPENMADWRYNRLVEIIDNYPEFAELAAIRKAFFAIYESSDETSARKAYSHWKRGIPSTPAYDSMRKFAKTTFRNWGTEIFNYFKVDGKKTNATTERLNGAIKSMQNMGRGYSFRVLRAKMLFGSQTAKRPLYRRISKYCFEEKEPYEANKYAVKFMSFSDIDDTDAEINRINMGQFEMDPCEGGGVWELGTYYGGKEREIQIADCDLAEYSRKNWDEWNKNGHYSISTAIPRNRGLELVENGGVPIEEVIKYGHEHGECI